jgi:hypothetical protein
VDRFPVRWKWWGRDTGTPGTGDWEAGWGVSDLYYADLYEDGTTNFETWDRPEPPGFPNGNGLYGEIEFAPDGNFNNDEIDIHPDVAVARIPASTGDEVEAYVNKVILYEMRTMPSQDWFETAGLYTGCWADSDNASQDQVGDSLENEGFSLLPISENQRIRYGRWTLNPNCYQRNPTATPPHPGAPPLNMPQTIIDDLNAGLGFANYIGHGTNEGWAELSFLRASLTLLTNSDMLPVATSPACDTGSFARVPPRWQYRDQNGLAHCGSFKAEVFNPGPYPHGGLPRPHPVQDGAADCNGDGFPDPDAIFDMPCFAESLISGNPIDPTDPTGAIAYLGNRTNGRPSSVTLNRFFYEGYDSGLRILGDIWRYMVEKYITHYDLENAHTWPHDPNDWQAAHVVDEPHKLIVFGDPSLVIGGAFRHTVGGTISDTFRFRSYSRYRITTDASVSAGGTVTAEPSTSILFEEGRKITAMGTGTSQGFIVNGTSADPVHLMSLGSNPQAVDVVRGVRVSGQMLLRNGGAIRLH